MFRAAEQVRPLERRIVDDPYAQHFLPIPQRLAARAFGLRPQRSVIGLATYVLARHASLDAALVAADVDQVVLLGAGYDSRAWRLRDRLGDTVVWEVDHPATARAKGRVAAGLPEVPRRVVEVDFQREDLRTRLEEDGFDASRRTFWVWEGVSMYLSRSAVQGTLATVHALSAPGSQLGMDLWFYLDDPRVTATWRRASASMLALLGEPITFGVHPKDAKLFFSNAGFDLQAMFDAENLSKHFVPGDGRWAMPECYVVTCSATSRGDLAQPSAV